jgi:hypothetical protein
MEGVDRSIPVRSIDDADQRQLFGAGCALGGSCRRPLVCSMTC